MQKLKFEIESEKYAEPLAICKISEDEAGNKIYTPNDFLIVHELTKKEEKELHNNDSRKDIAYITSKGNIYVASDIKYKTKRCDTLPKKETAAIFKQLMSQENPNEYDDTKKQKIGDALDIYLSGQ